MENASKALIIAGAILISILLISVGIMIFNSSSGLFNSATSKMSDQEKQMFNSSFKMYQGSRVSGSTVKQLMREIEINNANSEENPTISYGEGSAKEESEIINAYQYTVTCEDAKDSDGVIDTVTIKKYSASSGS